MTLHRRLILYVLLAVPLAWLIALIFSIQQMTHEVDELYDTQLVRMAEHIQNQLPLMVLSNTATPPLIQQDKKFDDLGIAVWNAKGKLISADHQSQFFPFLQVNSSTFYEASIDHKKWHLYFIKDQASQLTIATGQKSHERKELIEEIVENQIFPWLLMLPALLLAMSIAIKKTFKPLQWLASEIEQQAPDSDFAIDEKKAPTELRPLVRSLNSSRKKTQQLIAHERRFTSDAAHELRTPLAALKAQWELIQKSSGKALSSSSRDQLQNGFLRLERLVSQMLEMAKLDAFHHQRLHAFIDWQALIKQVVADLMPLMDQKKIELICEGLETSSPVIKGHPLLMEILVRNLLDNAIRYSCDRHTVKIHLHTKGLTISNQSSADVQQMKNKWGERFYRPLGIKATGSGLGISIAQKIAQWHGLILEIKINDDHRVETSLTMSPQSTD